MKEKEFIKYLEEQNLKELIINSYYVVDNQGNVIIDNESIKEEFELKLRELNEIIE